MASSPGDNSFVEVDLLSPDISEIAEGSVHNMLAVDSENTTAVCYAQQAVHSWHHNGSCKDSSSDPVACTLLNSSATEHIVSDPLIVKNDRAASPQRGNCHSENCSESISLNSDADSLVHNDSPNRTNNSSDSDSDLRTFEDRPVRCTGSVKFADSVSKCRCVSAVSGNEDMMTIQQLQKQVKNLLMIEQGLRVEQQAMSEELSKLKLQMSDCSTKSSDQTSENVCEEDVIALREQIAQVKYRVGFWKDWLFLEQEDIFCNAK